MLLCDDVVLLEFSKKFFEVCMTNLGNANLEWPWEMKHPFPEAKQYIIIARWSVVLAMNKNQKKNYKHKQTKILKTTYTNTKQKQYLHKTNVNNANCTHFRIKFEGEHCWLTKTIKKIHTHTQQTEKTHTTQTITLKQPKTTKNQHVNNSNCTRFCSKFWGAALLTIPLKHKQPTKK